VSCRATLPHVTSFRPRASGLIGTGVYGVAWSIVFVTKYCENFAVANRRLFRLGTLTPFDYLVEYSDQPSKGWIAWPNAELLIHETITHAPEMNDEPYRRGPRATFDAEPCQNEGGSRGALW
jgi:hypothetical protein